MVGNYDVMGLQDAAVANMTRPAAGTADGPGRAVAAKSGRNRSFLEQNPGDLRSQLFRKAGWKLDRRDVQAGGQVVLVDPGNTTRTCSRCGSLNDGTGTDRARRCASCRLELDQDANAAVNGENRVEGDSFNVTITFSEDIGTTFTHSDITASNADTITAADLTTDTAGLVFTLTVRPTAGFSGDLTLQAGAGVATDASSKANAQSNLFTAAVTVKSACITGAAAARAALERAGSSFGRYAHPEVEAHWILAVHHVRRGNHIEALRHCRQALSHPATKGYPPVQVARLERLLKILKPGKPADPSKGEETPTPASRWDRDLPDASRTTKGQRHARHPDRNAETTTDRWQQ